MTWARLDDGFTRHPKVLALGSAKRRWTWLEILIYTCAYDNPRLPASLVDVIPGATERFLRDCEDLSLLDLDENGRRIIHDWHVYNGSIEDRVASYLELHPEASANEVQAAIKGKREVVLAVVKRHKAVPGNQNGGSEGTSFPVPEVVPTASAPAPTEKQQLPTPPQAAVEKVRKPRAPDLVWDFVVSIEGEPLDRYRAARGRIVEDLKLLLKDFPPGRHDSELRRRHGALAREWGDSKATARALVQHWHRAATMNGHASHAARENAAAYRSFS